MTEAIITDNQNSIVIDSATSPEVVVTSEQGAVIVGVPEQQTTVVTGLLGPPGKNGSSINTYNFNASLEWLVVHNKNTTKFVPVLFDSTGSQFFAKVNVIDTNTFVVKLTQPVAGYVSVIFQGLQT